VSAPVCSRRVSAGITPAPGTTSRLPVWWGRTDWLEVEVRGALREHPEVCKAHRIAPDTVRAVAAAHAAFADSRTGRDCRPTNERVMAAAQCSLSTIKRGRRVLKELGLMVEVTAGRSVMTVAERLAAWERGSSHRQIAAEFVLCSRRNRRPRLAVDNSRADQQVVDRDPPPVGQVVRPSVTSRRTPLRSQSRDEEGRSAPAHTEKSRPRPAGGPDPRPRRLAETVRWRLTWLRDVPTSRMVPTLSKFARAGWSARDVERAVDDVLAARGWRLPALLQHPAAYLAGLLREVDPADRPGALDEHMAAVERAQRVYERQLVHGVPCPHGQPAGDVPSPLRGSLACPSCRASASAG
jgi:hypothetical protein